jgi:hypothetical protein
VFVAIATVIGAPPVGAVRARALSPSDRRRGLAVHAMRMDLVAITHASAPHGPQARVIALALSGARAAWPRIA